MAVHHLDVHPYHLVRTSADINLEYRPLCRGDRGPHTSSISLHQPVAWSLLADTAMSALLKSHMLNDRLLHDTATSTQVMSYNGFRPNIVISSNHKLLEIQTEKHLLENGSRGFGVGGTSLVSIQLGYEGFVCSEW